MSLFGVRKNRVQSVSRSVNMRHTKDFDWRPAKNNPFKKKEEEKNAKRKISLMVGVCVVSFGATAGILLYHPAFRMTQITVEGTKRVAQTDVQSVVSGIMEGKRFLFVPQSNYFFANLDDVESILLERYPIHAVEIKKQFPNQITVIVSEKQAAFLYDNGRQYSYIDEDGIVVDVLKNIPSDEWREQKSVQYTAPVVTDTTSTTSTDTTTTASMAVEAPTETVLVSRTHIPDVSSLQAEFGPFPVIYDVRALQTKKDSQTLDQATLQSISLYYEELKKRLIDIRFVEVDETGQFGYIKTGEGWDLLVRLDPQIVSAQMSVYDQAKAESKKSETTPNYIDIRYSGRAYWK
jgi:hypothetical protein